MTSSLAMDRERVIQSLCAHYANDHLTTPELEARFDLAYQATSVAELEALVATLPALPRDRAPARLPATRPDIVAPVGAMLPQKSSIAFWSQIVRRGEWIPARRNVVRAVMGSATLDLREALLWSGEIEFELHSFLAEIKVIVPPGLRVSCDGLAIMGEFQEYHAAGAEDPDAPLVRIHGSAFMASVNIDSRYVGESARDAKRRRRLQAKREG